MSEEGYAREGVVQDGQASPLPTRVKELISAQVSRPIFDTTSLVVPACTVAAQNSSPPRFLADNECAPLGPGGRAARILRDSCDDIVRAARREVTEAYPGIDMPGGDLYPAFRADACWRDLQNFVRVASYGCVCVSDANAKYLNPEGCAILNSIYNELEVPRRAMLTGIRACSSAAGSIIGEKDDEAKQHLQISFEELVSIIGAMGSTS
jgi:Phycobilisome protein